MTNLDSFPIGRYCCYLLLVLTLQLANSQSALAQSTKLRTMHYLPDSLYKIKVNIKGKDSLVVNRRYLRYFGPAKKPATPKVETVLIEETVKGQDTKLITRTTTTQLKPGAEAKSRKHYARQFTPSGTAFFVEHKKDTLFLEPIPYQDTARVPLGEAKFFNRAIKRVTFYVPIDKQYGYTTLKFKTREVGVMLVPFRVYLGQKLQPTVTGGGAVYHGWTRGTRYYYDDGTSVSLSHLWGVYVGFTQVEVTPENSDNQVAAKSTEPAFTLGGMYLFGRDELKVGPVLGFDVPLTQKGRRWDYAYYPYLGVSLSLSLSVFKI